MSSSEDFKDAATDYGPLTRQQAENIADLAARRAEERMYEEIGRSVVKKAIYLAGAVGLLVYAFLKGWFAGMNR